MRKNLSSAKCLLLLVVFITVLAQYSFAQVQSVTATAGDYLQGQNIAVSFTLGESTIYTLENPGLTVTQGFQQAKLLVTSVNEAENIDFSIEAYPNPVMYNLNLVFNEMLSIPTSYVLYNSYGQVILEKKVDALTTKISFQALVPAVYILKVFQGAVNLKTFKVIKK